MHRRIRDSLDMDCSGKCCKCLNDEPINRKRGRATESGGDSSLAKRIKKSYKRTRTSSGDESDTNFSPIKRFKKSYKRAHSISGSNPAAKRLKLDTSDSGSEKIGPILESNPRKRLIIPKSRENILKELFDETLAGLGVGFNDATRQWDVFLDKFAKVLNKHVMFCKRMRQHKTLSSVIIRAERMIKLKQSSGDSFGNAVGIYNTQILKKFRQCYI